MRNGAVPLAVFGDVGVHQIKGHAADAHLPDVRINRTAGVRHFEYEGLIRALHHLLQRQGGEVLRLIVGYLLAVHGQRLSEITIAVEEADGREIHVAVAGLLQVVTGQHTEATGVDLEHVRQAVFHAEIGDRGFRRVGRFGHVILELLIDAVDFHHQLIVGQYLVDPSLGQLLEQQHGVPLGRLPQVGRDLTEKFSPFVVPHPPEVAGDFIQRG